ncbi:uncharacterized protein LOC131649643 [Vicia villosa]|uniref:uncharacterized protein LOC131649643 n=1 Tax=Vicia villosa TaxID=3911 RepID=UPI00273C198A|nr:uncharacterized protein LOC131649643 [Vicia villosa]
MGYGDINKKAPMSVWWSDLLAIDRKLPNNFLGENLFFRIGNGFTTSFWHSAWLKEGPIKLLFPSLFSLSRLQDVSIAGMGGWSNGVWNWNDFGLANMPAEAAGTTTLMLDFLHHSDGPIDGSTGDSPGWRLTDQKCFTVSSCYEDISKRKIAFGPPNRYDCVLELLRICDVPLKCRAFGWRCFRDRIPTKDSLVRKGISFSPTDLSCSFCGISSESSRLSFLLCGMADEVWKYIASWIGLEDYKAEYFKESFWIWHSFCYKKKVKRGKLGSVWLATLWTLWLHRNKIIFKNFSSNSRDVGWDIKALVWRWAFIGNITHANFNFYEFEKNPLFFLS